MEPQEQTRLTQETPSLVKEIMWNPQIATLLVSLEKNLIDIDKVRAIAQQKGLFEKEEIHLTIIGYDTGEKILNNIDKSEVETTLKSIEEAAKNVHWQCNLKPEYYHITQHRDHPKTEIKESIIQIVEISGLKEFYEKLEVITGVSFDLPFPHITLFTTSTREDMKQRGIGIYSKEDFKNLDPQKIDP